MDRRLAAVMATDMEGYSRMMETGEMNVLSRQKLYRKELMEPEIASHRGQIIKTDGR